MRESMHYFVFLSTRRFSKGGISLVQGGLAALNAVLSSERKTKRNKHVNLNISTLY